MRDVFEEIYKENKWKSDESVSGHGSTAEATKHIVPLLEELLRELGTWTMLDIPCGDMNWMRRVNIGSIRYIGADIVPELIKRNKELFDFDNVSFQVLDITKDDLPKVDVVLVRDCLGHLSNRNVQKALRNIRRSGSTWLLSTTFPDHENPNDIKDGEWRPINLASMFGLPDPSMTLVEGCKAGNGKFADKSLGLWRIN